MASQESIPNFEHQIQVDRRLIGLLSENTYTSFANCLRELVVNAYDADATEVRIDFEIPQDDLEKDYLGQMRIEDNGIGMSAQDFIRFSRIAPGRVRNEYTARYGRSKVGRFGIGYLAAFPFCKMLEVRTTEFDSDREVVATFNCAGYFEEADTFSDIGDVPVDAHVDVLQGETHRYREGTILTLHGLTKSARRLLVFQQVGDVEARYKTPPVDSIANWSSYKRLKWELGQTLPIRWEGFEKFETILGIRRANDDPGLEVTFNGDKLVKPWPRNRTQNNENETTQIDDLLILTPIETDGRFKKVVVTQRDASELVGKRWRWPRGNQFSYRYLALTPMAPIHPQEFRGIQLRLRGVALGSPLPYVQLKLPKEGYLVRVYVEIHLLEGFDEQITLNRHELKHSIFLDALIASIREKVLEDAKKKVTAALHLERDVKALIGTQNSIVPPQQLIESIKNNAIALGFEIKETAPSIKDARVLPAQREVVLPTELPEPSVSVDGQIYFLVDGSTNNPDLDGAWLTYQDGNHLQVGQGLFSLREQNSRNYAKLIRLLAICEHRTQLALRNVRAVVVREAMESINKSIKAGIVQEHIGGR